MNKNKKQQNVPHC